jgi:hypothetical protein
LHSYSRLNASTDLRPIPYTGCRRMQVYMLLCQHTTITIHLLTINFLSQGTRINPISTIRYRLHIQLQLHSILSYITAFANHEIFHSHHQPPSLLLYRSSPSLPNLHPNRRQQNPHRRQHKSKMDNRGDLRSSLPFLSPTLHSLIQ